MLRPKRGSKREWSELSARERGGIVALAALQAALAVIAQRDLSSRPDAAIRGPRLLWRVVTLNTGGAIAYLLFGRLRVSRSE